MPGALWNITHLKTDSALTDPTPSTVLSSQTNSTPSRLENTLPVPKATIQKFILTICCITLYFLWQIRVLSLSSKGGGFPPPFTSQGRVVQSCNRRQNFGEQKNPHPSPVPSIQSWGICCFLQVARTRAQHCTEGMGEESYISSF